MDANVPNGTRVRHLPSGETGVVSNASGRPAPRDGSPVVVVRFDRVPDWNLGRGLADWAAPLSDIRVADLEEIE